MKKTMFLAILFLGLTQSVYAWTLKTGTYELRGESRGWNGYKGEVIIAPHGDVYTVVWLIGSKQAQIGVGILKNDILSVAFSDLTQNAFWGVASYKVGPWGDLEGTWVDYTGSSQKSEYLAWKSYSTSVY